MLFLAGRISNCHTLEELQKLALDCTNCNLRQNCRGVVFGEGNPHAAVMCIGEGPGAEEDNQGRPFVGPAGQLLDRILEAAGFRREDVYIGNIVKCRPPNNRVPKPEEAAACLPWLYRQIELIDPAIIILLGATAAQAIIDPNARITKIRGQWIIRDGRKIMPTYHPAALLRDPTKKRPVWEDFKQIRDLYQKL